MCLGKQLAESEVLLFFTSLLQRFHLIEENQSEPLCLDGINVGAIQNPQPFKMYFKTVDEIGAAYSNS